jgi:hypothetical protein
LIDFIGNTIKTTTQFSLDKVYETLDPDFVEYDKPRQVDAIQVDAPPSTDQDEPPSSPIKHVAVRRTRMAHVSKQQLMLQKPFSLPLTRPLILLHTL